MQRAPKFRSSLQASDGIGPTTVLRGRRDIVWQRSSDGSGDQWYAYDPVSRIGYRCGVSGRWLFDQLDGQRSLQEIHRLSAVYPDLHIISLHEIEEMARTLRTRGLVRDCTDTSCASAMQPPSATAPARANSGWMQWIAQSVSWRLRGIDPHRRLVWLAPHTDLFLTKLAVKTWLVLACLVTLCVVADFARLMHQATLWDWMIRPASGSVLVGIFMMTRAIHELGHALVLTRLGGRCPDIGLIFMLGAPCVYCDVNDSWRLPSWRHRAAVAAGGMFAELIVATLAGIFWLCTVDGWANTLALQTMIVCSTSTILINANPLMRFDGYYMLSDWLNETNLRATADRRLLELVRSMILWNPGLSRFRSVFGTRGCLLALFSLAGLGYRLSLSLMMASLLISVYAAWHFEWPGRILAVLLLLIWWVVPTMKLAFNLLKSAGGFWPRFRLGVVAAWLVLLACAIPLPCRQSALGWIQAREMQGLYVQSGSRLESVHKLPGQRVQAGELIAQLSDVEPRLRSIQLHHAADQARVQLVSLRRQRYFTDSSKIDLSSLENAVQAADGLATHADDAIHRMSIRAGMTGSLISMPAPHLTDIDQKPVFPSVDLWLDQQQTGRSIPSGTMLGAICSDERVAVIPLTDMQLRDITIGTDVRLRIMSADDRILQGKVSDIVRTEQLDTASRLMAESAARQIPTAPTGSSTSPSTQPAAPIELGSGYAAIVPLVDNSPTASVYPFADIRPGASLQAVFVVPAKTLARRASEWMRNNARWLLP